MELTTEKGTRAPVSVVVLSVHDQWEAKARHIRMDGKVNLAAGYIYAAGLAQCILCKVFTHEVNLVPGTVHQHEEFMARVLHLSVEVKTLSFFDVQIAGRGIIVGRTGGARRRGD